MNKNLTVFHITHWKAGSQWVGQVLREAAPERFVTQEVKIFHFLKNQIVHGGVYPGVYVPKGKFFQVLNSQGINQLIHFIVIRDLRDTLISWYFSLKVSHSLLYDKMSARRDDLNELSREEGLLYMIERVLPKAAKIQSSWLEDDALTIKYEELIADELRGFKEIIQYCKLKVDPVQIEQIVRNCSFSNVTGRMPGEEVVESHYRKGIAGDWRNHFTDRIKETFKERFGELLIQTGYENDQHW